MRKNDLCCYTGRFIHTNNFAASHRCHSLSIVSAELFDKLEFVKLILLGNTYNFFRLLDK